MIVKDVEGERIQVVFTYKTDDEDEKLFSASISVSFLLDEGVETTVDQLDDIIKDELWKFVVKRSMEQ